jgi:catecholate siderophore receptor
MRRTTKIDRKRKTRTPAQGAWPIAYRWAAMGTLIAYSAVGSKTINAACAQELRGASPAAGALYQAQGAAPVRRFEISAGPLGDIVAAFEQAAGITVSFARSELRSVRSPGASGVYTPDQALQVLLEGTGLAYRFTSPGAVLIDLKVVAQSVDVTAEGEGLAVSSPKFTEPLRDTPQTIATVSLKKMEEQGATTLRDVLRNVAGISLAAGEGGAQGDNLTVRGFAARNDLFIDGMRDFGSYYRDPFNTQEVEVLQGPSSVSFGRGSTGGVVNQTTKTANLDKFIAGDLNFGTDLTRRVALDINRPLSLRGRAAAFRLNLMGHQSEVAGRDVAENRRFGVAPSLAIGLGAPTRWTFNYFHQTADDIPDYGIPWLFNGPAPVPHKNYYGFRNGNYLRTDDDILTAKLEHDVNSRVTIRNQARFANYKRDVLITEAQIPAGVTPSTPLSAIAVTRREIGVNSVESFLNEQLDVTARFETGFIKHTLVSGIEAGRETSNPERPTWSNVPPTSLLHPNPGDPIAGTAVITSRVRATAITAAAYALDTMKLGKRWSVVGGLRWDRFDADYAQFVAPASAFHRVDNMPSWRAALAYKPVEAATLYLATGTSFNPSAESLSLSASTADLPPEKNRTLEAGAKWDAQRGRLSLNAALFRTDKLNAREPDPNNPLLNVLAGSQRVNGVQVDAKLPITSRWDLQAAYAYLDARVVSSNYYRAAVGAALANVPRNTFNFWSSQRLPLRWETAIGGSFVSSRTASSTAPLDPVTGLVKQLPGYWVFNAMVRRPLMEHLDVQANLYNIANRYYYDLPHPGHIILGPSRSATIGLRFKF